MRYLAHSRRPSVSHRAIKAWFGPTVYYARRSRYKTLVAFPEFVNRQTRSEVPDGYVGDMYVDSDGVLRPGVQRWPSECLMTDLDCEGYRGKDGRVWRDGRWQEE
jgi:hypothetical protein